MSSIRRTKTDRDPGSVARFLIDDHARLEDLLRRASADPRAIDRTAYARFRAGLLKHIAMEEKILLPAARRARGGQPLPIAAKLRLDHGALAALLVPTPTAPVIAAIRTVLSRHNALEEGPDCVYDVCERSVGSEGDALLATLRAARDVPVRPHADGPKVMDAARRAQRRAGYEWDLTL
jgi:hypothetical protein